MVSRNSFGIRVFNAATMLSNVLVSAGGKTIVVQLVNYSDYAVENLTVMFPSGYKKAAIVMPEGTQQNARDISCTPARQASGSQMCLCARR